MLKAIVFDFGNVLAGIDYRRALTRLTRHTDLSAEDIVAAVIGKTLEDEYETGRINTAEFLAQIQTACCLRCTKDELAAAFVDIFVQHSEVCALVPRLKSRYKLLLGSNTNDLHAVAFKRDFAKTLAHFDALVLSHEIGVRKPRAAFFEHCQRLAGFAPHECLFIDDLPINVAGAEACGWHGIVFRGIDDLRNRLEGLGVNLNHESAA